MDPKTTPQPRAELLQAGSSVKSPPFVNFYSEQFQQDDWRQRVLLQWRWSLGQWGTIRESLWTFHEIKRIARQEVQERSVGAGSDTVAPGQKDKASWGGITFWAPQLYISVDIRQPNRRHIKKPNSVVHIPDSRRTQSAGHSLPFQLPRSQWCQVALKHLYLPLTWMMFPTKP